MTKEPDPAVLVGIWVVILLVGFVLLGFLATVADAIFEMLGALFCSFINWLTSESEEDKRRAAEQQALAQQHQAQVQLLTEQIAWDEHQANMALPCPKCELLATPIPKTVNRYSCDCGHRFVSADHNIDSRPT